MAELDAIKASLNALSDALRKRVPWILVHLGKETEVIREECAKKDTLDCRPD